MSVELVALAVLMAAVTYPSRAVPMLLPGIERLPDVVHEYLRLIGPAILASLAVVNVLVLVEPDGAARLHAGVEGLAVLVAIAVMAWRRNLLLALLSAVVLVATVRALGLPA
jgi:branched-subunit amino acid transport protein